jgi:glycerophosphoryl diester phosphodiesterase
MNHKLIIAHRGAADLAPENTIEAFSMACKTGADMIELDIRMTRDQIPVVFHDKTIAGQSVEHLECNRLIELGALKKIAIPTLDEVLRFSQGKIKLNIELKVPGYEREIAALVSNYLSMNEYVFSSFELDSLISLKRIDTRHQTGLILGKEDSRFAVFTRLREIFHLVRKRHPAINYLIPHWKLFKLGAPARIYRSGLKTWIWTVNKPNQMMKYLRHPYLAGIITDKPGMAVSLYQDMLDQ